MPDESAAAGDAIIAILEIGILYLCCNVRDLRLWRRKECRQGVSILNSLIARAENRLLNQALDH
jgi:hypothetical protein